MSPAEKMQTLPLKDKIRFLLQEGRILILGSQVLLGFQFSAYFQSEFKNLRTSNQILDLTALLFVLVALVLLLWISSYHYIVARGEDSLDFYNFTNTQLKIVFIPLTIALAIDFYIHLSQLSTWAWGLVAAIGILGTCFCFWVALCRFYSKNENPPEEKSQPTRLEDKIDQVLAEARMVLPGVQALMGFQFIAILETPFKELPRSSQFLHFASFAAITLSLILLMSPAAFHRLVEQGNISERLYRFSARMILAAMLFIACGICMDFYVVSKAVLKNSEISLILSVMIFASFIIIWFGLTTYWRFRINSHARFHPPRKIFLY